MRLATSISAALLCLLPGPSAAQSDYVAWERAVRANCAKTATANAIDDMTSCAARMLERALADGHLTQEDIANCERRL